MWGVPINSLVYSQNPLRVSDTWWACHLSKAAKQNVCFCYTGWQQRTEHNLSMFTQETIRKGINQMLTSTELHSRWTSLNISARDNVIEGICWLGEGATEEGQGVVRCNCAGNHILRAGEIMWSWDQESIRKLVRTQKLHWGTHGVALESSRGNAIPVPTASTSRAQRKSLTEWGSVLLKRGLCQVGAGTSGVGKSFCENTMADVCEGDGGGNQLGWQQECSDMLKLWPMTMPRMRSVIGGSDAKT